MPTYRSIAIQYHYEVSLKRLFIIHSLALEFYPPITNLLRVLEKDNRFDVRVFSTHNNKKREVFSSTQIPIYRTVYPAYAKNLIIKLWAYLGLIVKPVWLMLRFRPKAVFYLEPHSALPIYLYKRFFNSQALLYIHHHEFYSKEDFYGPSMAAVRFFHSLETKYLFKHAAWISQTNIQRLELFGEDYPFISPGVLHTMANYPPNSWKLKIKKLSSSEKIRLLYIGALSFENTYIRALVEYVLAYKNKLSLTIYSFNVSGDVQRYLENQDQEIIMYHKNGVNYNDIPSIANSHDVGLVIYKGHNLNYIYNAPNKLFEYLACRLDVWIPQEIEGCKPYLNENGRPAVKSIDFSELNSELIAQYCQRKKVSCVESIYYCEEEVAPLVASLLKTP